VVGGRSGIARQYPPSARAGAARPQGAGAARPYKVGRAHRRGNASTTTEDVEMAGMKWWGWGLDGVEFSHEDKPALAPFIRERIGLDVTRPTVPPPRFEQLDVPPSRLPDGLRAALERAVGAE